MIDQQVSLLTLPYDVRHLIYQHLFPPLRQIYILAGDDTLQLMNNNHTVYTSIFKVSKALHTEASEFFYSRYLFNIVGRKEDCLKLYRPFLDTLSKHAREPAHIHPFTNGEHSITSCISIQAGDAQLKTLQSRRRGKPRTIEEIQAEIESSLAPNTTLLLAMRRYTTSPYVHFLIVAVMVAILAIVLV